ncbi:hypothetical protein SLS56_007061 [Neofusicoccum ribis]|uniref:AAA+ ATPase domain-containing protein n=1 Tax=Neofusicoccum ribis TaxID=45134 RepID=A0ABR3SP41_9PEZI
MKSADIPDDPFALLLPAHVLGYGLQDKKWRSLDVDFVEDLAWNSTAFERLVLSPRKKEIIKALVTVHVDTSTSIDIIEGKGNGLIMLLHGSPGTGKTYHLLCYKTLTAESIAELTHKPLYRVTCGDIGTEPEAVEKYLESVLYIGTTWGCVVLLDEADVFLEERTQSDLQRNALVSVFLRVLEYYYGILILTSNRVGTFDEAFKSRIQLAVHYPRLDRRGRCRIWNGFISGLDAENDSIDVERLRENVDVLAQYELNGRQIRNTVRSARQLAYYKNERLGFEHFDAVIEVANEFEEYLTKVHGHGDSDWAKSQMIRAE